MLQSEGLYVQNLTFSYAFQPLLERLSFEIVPGECLHIQGKNGCGKSTLLRVLVGLIRPHEGGIYWRGVPIDESYLRHLVYVGHQNGLSEALTLEENLKLDWHYGCSDDLPEGIEILALTDHVTTPIAHLSKGQQRKAALLRLWMTDALLWVLDEPFTALDQGAQSAILQRMQAHIAAQGMVIFTSHQVCTELSPLKMVNL